MEPVICLVVKILDNTFFGTLFAGALLAVLAQFLYRRQKDIDMNYGRKAKLNESGSKLFASMEIANRFYAGQINSYDNSNKDINAIYAIANKKFDNHFHIEAVEKSNLYYKEIDSALNEFVAQIKINNLDGQVNLTELTQTIGSFGLHLMLISVFQKSTQEEIIDYRKTSEALYIKIQEEIKSILSMELTPKR